MYCPTFQIQYDNSSVLCINLPFELVQEEEKKPTCGPRLLLCEESICIRTLSTCFWVRIDVSEIPSLLLTLYYALNVKYPRAFYPLLCLLQYYVCDNFDLADLANKKMTKFRVQFVLSYFVYAFIFQCGLNYFSVNYICIN